MAARKGLEMERCEIHRLPRRTSSPFSGTDVAICAHASTRIYTHAHSHQSLAYRKRYQTQRKIELGNMGSVICGKPFLRLGEKYGLERTSSYGASKEEGASVLFI